MPLHLFKGEINMATIIDIDAAPAGGVQIGRQGEYDFREVVFNMASWVAGYPGGKVTIIFERPDGKTYPVVTAASPASVRWKLSAADLSVAGAGRIEARISTDIGLGKSAVIPVTVAPSITDVGVTPQNPVPDWTYTVAANANRAADAAAEAAAAAAGVENTIQTALAEAKASGEFDGADGADGEDGGYYTPEVTQPEANTLQFDFAPSKPDMPVLEPVQVNLPTPESGGNVDLTGYATEQFVREYAQPVGNYALKNEIPAVPVKSVNGKTGAVSLTASDVGALPSTYTPPNQTAAQVGADPKGTAAAAVGQHNTAVDSHNDIRLEMKAINDRLTAFFDSDDQTLDELSEIVAYITSNKALIDSITTSKVSVVDIINNLTTNVTNKPLSAAQGVALKGLIDGLTSGKLDANKLPEAINTALSQAKASGEFDGADGADGSNGKDGTSVTVKSVSESAADGGDNVVTFSDGKTITIKNGRKGGDGPAGADGKTPVKGTDYYTAADKAEMVASVIAALPDASEVSY